MDKTLPKFKGYTLEDDDVPPGVVGIYGRQHYTTSQWILSSHTHTIRHCPQGSEEHTESALLQAIFGKYKSHFQQQPQPPTMPSGLALSWGIPASSISLKASFTVYASLNQNECIHHITWMYSHRVMQYTWYCMKSTMLWRKLKTPQTRQFK